MSDNTQTKSQPKARFFGVPLTPGSSRRFTAVALCPEVRHFATISDHSKLSIADRTTLKHFQIGSLEKARLMSFRPKNEGKGVEIAIVGDEQSKAIQRLDLATESLMDEMAMEAVTAIAYSPDGSLFAAGNANGLVCVWQLEGPHAFLVSRTNLGVEVTSLAFHPNNQALFTVTMLGKASRWYFTLGDSAVDSPLTRALENSTTFYRLVTTSADGNNLYLAADETVHVYDTVTGKAGEISPNVGWISGLQVFPNNGQLCVFGYHAVYVSNPVGPDTKGNLALHSPFEETIYAVSPIDADVILVFHVRD